MRATRVIEALREVPLPLEYFDGKVEYAESDRYDDRLSEGNRWSKTPIEYVCFLSIDEVYNLLISNPFFSWRINRYRGVIDFDSIPIASKTGRMFFNIRFVKLSHKTCALVGYITYIRKDML